jgi:cell division GTPase FtsZ
LIESLRKNQAAKDIIRDVLRKEFEKHKYQSVLVFHSIAGGTGAGLGSCVLVEVANLRSRVCVTVNVMHIPSEHHSMSTNALEWYNASSALDTVNEQCELTIIIDNQALYRIYKQNAYGLGIEDLNVNIKVFLVLF